MLLPRWRALFYCIALVTAAERVLQNSHYVSDVAAAIGIGIVAAAWTLRLFGDPKEKNAGYIDPALSHLS